MKKISLFVLIISMMLIGTNVNAAVPVASNNLDYTKCISFAEGFKTINALNGARGDYYYKSCYRYSCAYGVYNRANMTSSSGYRCNNGNGNPYVNVSSSGCKNYTGTCNTTNVYYCTTVEYIDCQKNADGTPYAQEVKTTTVITPTKPTTKKPTTKRPTTKNTTTTRKTTKKTTQTTTESTTTTTAEPKKSNNTDLKRLSIFETEIKVDNKKSNYTIKAPYDITSLDIVAEPADEKATVEITGNENLPNEESKVNINITAEDGTKKTVTITVKRYNGENNDCTLANIFIEDYPLDFDKNTLDYTLKLPKSTKSLDLEVIPTDELNAKYEIKGNEKLKDNSKIEIIVVAQDGTKCNYTIKVKKANNTWKYIILIILLIAALITSSYFLYKYLKKSKGRYKYE